MKASKWSPAARNGLAASCLCLLLAGSLVALPLLTVAANRLVPGVPANAMAATGRHLPVVGGLAVSGLLLLAATRRRDAAVLALVALVASVAILALGLGAGAADLVAGRPSATRASLAAGAWCALPVLGIAVGWAVRRCRVPGLAPAVAAGLAVFLVVAGRAGAFDQLSLAVEFQARRAVVIEAIGQHLVLAAGALVLAVAAAVAASLWRRGQGLVEIVAAGLQVIPAVALLGALVAVASALLRMVPALREVGFSALGAGPAVVGIAAYLLLPLWRGLAAALNGTDPAILDAARAIGLTPAQILVRVTLPLGAPILVGALRVGAVQSLGLATLGALVGAGGLGRIVFDGMAQFAPDLILLGALPIIGLSLATETALSLVEARARRRWHA